MAPLGRFGPPAGLLIKGDMGISGIEGSGLGIARHPLIPNNPPISFNSRHCARHGSRRGRAESGGSIGPRGHVGKLASPGLYPVSLKSSAILSFGLIGILSPEFGHITARNAKPTPLSHLPQKGPSTYAPRIEQVISSDNAPLRIGFSLNFVCQNAQSIVCKSLFGFFVFNFS